MKPLLPVSPGKKVCVVVAAMMSVYLIYRIWKSTVREVMEGFTYVIEKTWDGKPFHHAKIEVSLVRSGNAVELRVQAPFMNNPPAPSGEPGKPFPQLWDYEVVEAFFLNDKEEYLEVELCPHGQHLVLMLKGKRNIVKDKLPLNFISKRQDGEWTGRAFIPIDFFPPSVTKFNAYAIHGSGGDRKYEALNAVPGSEPDFHRLEFFQDIDFQKIVPENIPPHYKSSHWRT